MGRLWGTMFVGGALLSACGSSTSTDGTGVGGQTVSAAGGATTGGMAAGANTATGGTGGEGLTPPSSNGGTPPVGTGGSSARAASQAGASESGGDGIAARHPNDEGIDADPDVLFADDFESYAEPSELEQRWDVLYQRENVLLTREPDNVFAGAQALEFSMPVQPQEISNALDKILAQEQDVLFLRYYSKFQAPYDIVGSSHNGSTISAHYFNDGMATPGVRADGQNKFLVALENWRGEAETPSPGLLNLYVYHPEQRDDYGDHWFLTGLVSPNTSLPYDFGADFTPHEDIIPELDRWYCYEYMVKANTVGARDGEVTVWLDGEQLVTFRNLRFRDVETLEIDRFGINFHIHDNANGDRKFYDNVVAAKQYIGPVAVP